MALALRRTSLFANPRRHQLMHSLYLASGSPRRQLLLKRLSTPFSIIEPNIDETPLDDELPENYVSRLATTKAKAGFNQLSIAQQKTAYVLGADTIVSLENNMMGKPTSQQQAVTMLQSLSGKTHKVFTAIALYYSDKLISNVIVTEVTMRLVSIEEAVTYWHTGEPKGKAGGYAIQGIAATFIEQIKGDYYAVVGLPLFATSELLKQAGIYSLTSNRHQNYYEH